MNGVKQVFTYKEESVRADGHPCVSMVVEKDASVTADIEKGTILSWKGEKVELHKVGTNSPRLIAEFFIPKDDTHGTVITHGSVNKKLLKIEGAAASEESIRTLFRSGVFAV